MTNDTSTATIHPDPAIAPESEDVSLDKFYKVFFSTFLPDLVEILHPRLAKELILEKAEILSESAFADLRTLGHVVSDIAIKVVTHDQAEPVAVIHIETEARFSSEMKERMRRYQLQLELKFDQPVIAIVVFLKGGPPGVTVQRSDRKVGPWTCGSSNYLSFGLSGCLAEEWVNRPERIAPALAALMKSKIWGPADKKLACLRAIADEPDNDKRYLLTRAVDLSLKLKKSEQKRFEAMLAAEAPEVKKMVITWNDALTEREARGIAVGEARGIAVGEARGIAVGEARGKVEGIAVGEARGIRGSVELLLGQRLGTVPSAVRQKLASIADLSRLSALLGVAASATSLAEFEAALSEACGAV